MYTRGGSVLKVEMAISKTSQGTGYLNAEASVQNSTIRIAKVSTRAVRVSRRASVRTCAWASSSTRASVRTCACASSRTISLRSVTFVSAPLVLPAKRRQSRLDGLNLRFTFGQTVTLLLDYLGTGFAQKIGVGELAP